MEKPIHDRTLAIVAMGNSSRDYMFYNYDKKKGQNVADEVWAINSMAFIIQCDMAVSMDDMKTLEERYPGGYADRIKALPVPVLTSRGYDDYSNLVEYPIADVISEFQFKYLNGSVAYALAYALWKGYKKIILYGCDYMYDHKPGLYEKGRGCVEFWIAVGTLHCNAEVMVAQTSTLMDSNHPRLYGYREQPDLEATKQEDGKVMLRHVGWIPDEEPKQEEAGKIKEEEKEDELQE